MITNITNTHTMNHIEAFEILEIDLQVISPCEITSEYIKKQYRRLALKNHPDKNNNSTESTNRFRRINDAYIYLQNEMNIDDELELDGDINIDTSLYLDILKGFMMNVFNGKYTDLISEIVNDIMTTGKKISTRLFDNLSKEVSFEIYTFLSNNRYVLHIHQDVLEKVRGIIIEKFDTNVEVYKLNPCILDLIDNNLYKLYVDDILYLVPLWHNETYFDGSGCEILVICEPELPSDITIDDNNNIIITGVSVSYSDLYELFLNDGSIEVYIMDRVFHIPVDKLYMKKNQAYKLKNMGLTNIKNDMYDISEKSDIIVNISIQ